MYQSGGCARALRIRAHELDAERPDEDLGERYLPVHPVNPSSMGAPVARREAVAAVSTGSDWQAPCSEPSTHAGGTRQDVVHVIEHSVHVGDVPRARRLQSLE